MAEYPPEAVTLASPMGLRERRKENGWEWAVYYLITAANEWYELSFTDTNRILRVFHLTDQDRVCLGTISLAQRTGEDLLVATDTGYRSIWGKVQAIYAAQNRTDLYAALPSMLALLPIAESAPRPRKRSRQRR